MENTCYRVVHYINQFFADEGGEDAAGIAPHKKDGAIGPGKLLERSSKGALEVVGTVICGDNYFAEDPNAIDKIVELVKEYKPDAFLAGPAFLAGRYGEACVEICTAIQERLSIPVITGLSPEHPSVERFRSIVNIVQSGNNAANMKNCMPVMTSILVKYIRDEQLSPQEQSALCKRGLKENQVKEKTAAARAVDMLLAKYRGEGWQTEIPIPVSELVAPARAVAGEPIKLAFVTDGGLMLEGNPERMPSGRCERYYEIDVKDSEGLSPDFLEVNHFGYDNRYVVADPHRLVPYDVAKKLEEDGKLILHPIVYSTAGAATAVESAAKIGKGIAEELQKAGVQAAILTST
jgi:glycine reductase